MITEIAPEIPESPGEDFPWDDFPPEEGSAEDVAAVEEIFKPLVSMQPKRTHLICDTCHVHLNMYRDRTKVLTMAFSEETIDGHVYYWCRDCTMKAYDEGCDTP